LTSGNTDVSLGEQKINQKRKHPNLQIFIICLFISVIMWMMIRLSREYSQEIRFSVNYKGLQSDKIILPASDTMFYVTLKSTGYNILFRNFKHQKYQTEIDLSQFTPKLQGNNFEISVALSGLRDLLSANFKQKDRIVSFQPENLNIRLDKAFIKKVPVILDAEISFEKQYSLYHKVYFDPDSVIVTGNRDLLKNIESVKTEKRTFNNLSSNTSVTLRLLNVYNPLNLRYSSEYVKVFIPVVQYAEDFIEVPISTDSLGSDTHVITLPDKIKIYYTVCVPDIKKVAVDSFKVSIMIPKSVNSNTANYARVILKHSPSLVKILRIEPENVEYSLKKQ
jgi:YbbR domain-containing protein